MKVPLIIACSLISLAVGVGVGALGAAYLGFTPDKTWPFGEKANDADGDKKNLNLGELKAGVMGQKGGGGPAGFGPPGKGGGKGPNVKAQLNALVAKLDILTEKPVTLNLNAEQKKQI